LNKNCRKKVQEIRIRDLPVTRAQATKLVEER